MKKRIALIVFLVLALCMLCFGVVSCDSTADDEHHLKKVEAHEPTCEDDGNIEYYRCTDKSCGKLFKDSKGKTQTTLKDVTLDKLGHTGGKATCQEKAVCTRCEQEYGELDTSENGHSWKAEWKYKDGEAGAEGHYKVCADCDAESTVVAHKPLITKAGKEATCVDDGLTAASECEICGYVISEQTTIPAAGHTLEHRKVRAATCDEDGYKIEHWYCTTCEKYFDSAECEADDEIDENEAIEKSSGHAYGDWESNNDGTHTRTCGNNNTHKETADCHGGEATCQAKAECEDCHTAYGELGDHDTKGALKNEGASGHYLTCSVCHEPQGEIVEHKLEVEYGDANHWEQCDCGYKTEPEDHEAISITAAIKAEANAKLLAGYTLTAGDIIVTAKCECGHTYTVEDGVVLPEKSLEMGNNEIEVDYNGLKTTINVNVTDEAANTLTLIGATFAGGSNTAELKPGATLPAVTLAADKTFFGFKDATQEYYTQDTFVMPAADLTITALYAEDMVFYAPSDGQEIKPTENTAEHRIYRDEKTGKDVIGTEITFKPEYSGADEKTEEKTYNARASKDSGSHKVNTLIPAYGRSFLMLAIVNENDEDYKVRYEAESWGVRGEVLMVTAKAHATTYVPFRYGDDTKNGTFESSDHRIALMTETQEDVKLGFYGYIAIDGSMAATGLNVAGIKTIYSNGDTFDLSTMSVQAILGENNYPVDIYNYTVSVEDGSTWNNSITEIAVSALGLEAVVKLNDLHDWTGFALSKGLGDKSWLSAEYTKVTGIDGTLQTATKFTISGGATSGQSSTLQTHTDNSATKSQNYNVRVPAASARNIMYIVTYTGSKAMSFKLGGDNGSGPEMTVQPGDTEKIFIGSVTGNKWGGWMMITLTSDAPEDGAVIEVYGYLQTNENEFSAIEVRGESQHKTAYSVGETLDVSNLVIRGVPSDAGLANDGDYTLNITSYKVEILDHDGNTFTEADRGKTFTVRVYWNNLETTFTVSVAA
ncbi:MAG: hypothetical protein J1G38_02390 [Clostridiales bacterium]|nr:hypothetical protein [Clostridiales bacterium]